MNKLQPLASQQAEAQRLVKLANKEGYDWLPMLELVASEMDPGFIAEGLLQIYLKVSAAIFQDDVDAPDVSRYMYTLSIVYEAFANMSQNDVFKTTIQLALEGK